MYLLGYGTKVIENRLKFSLSKANEIPAISKQYAIEIHINIRHYKAARWKRKSMTVN